MKEYGALTARLNHLNVIPVVALNTEIDALRVAEALMKAGLNCIEVTFRTDAADRCIQAVKREFPDMIVAAGTILGPEQCTVAIDVGSDFIVSPSLNPQTVEQCKAAGVPIIPGVCTPQQVEQGMAMGLTLLKFFPAEVYGGTRFLKALKPIYPVSFMPTGGIQASTWREYIDLPNVMYCGGSWIVADELVNQGNWVEIEARARATLG